MSKIYNKPPLSLDEQIKLLTSRGLIILDQTEARHYLSCISYYRFSGYTLAFEGYIHGKRDHSFKTGTTFRDVLNLYNFDSALRLLLMRAIEPIEVAVRTQICLKMALEYKDSHWYEKKVFFHSNFKYDKFLSDCRSEFNKSKEVFVSHYKNENYLPELPPSWMIIELLSLGTWSTVYKNLINRKDKKQISDAFDLSPLELESWLHSLTYIRNLCAHHARVWNRHFTITPITKPKYADYMTPKHSFATQVAMIHIFLSSVSPKNNWINQLRELINENSWVDITRMGFKKNYFEDDFWKNNDKYIL